LSRFTETVIQAEEALSGVHRCGALVFEPRIEVDG
jgi:hypothetical protein